MTDLTSPYTLTRWQVALASAEEYIRALWWILIGIPLFGILALVVAPNELIRGMGFICVVWPLTIPIRAVTASARAGALYGRPTTLAIDGDWLYLKGENGKGLRLARSEVWTVRLGGGVWRIKTRRLSVLLAPDAAVLPESRKQLAALSGH